MGTIDKDTLIETTKELVNRPSVNPGGTEEAVVQYVRDRLTASPVPFEVEITEVLPNRSNIIARAGNSEYGTLLLTGHMDVVPADGAQWTADPFTLQQNGDVLVGRGVADMKGALAAQLLATETYLRDAETPGEVILAFVVDEENGGTGTEHLVDNDLEADCAVIGEPTDLDVCIAQYGCSRYTVDVTGKSAHAGRPENGQNAIQPLPTVLAALEELNEAMDSYEHELLGAGSVTPTELHAGTAHNVIPDNASLTIDWRFPPGISDRPQWFDERLKKALPTNLKGEFTIDSNRYNFYQAVETDPDAEIVQVLLEAIDAAGHQAKIAGFHAGSDARFLTPDAEIPTVLFGPGSIEQDAHTVDESITTDGLETAADSYLELVERFFA